MRTANNRALARIGSIVAPRILDGKVWIRVEMLRGLGGLVDVDSTDVRVRANNRSLDRQALHAEKRDYGWWVPVAHVARSLGWKTAWVSAERTIIVETRPSIATSN
jgi:hypothetical protein